MKLTADKIFINAKAYTLEAEGVIKEAIVIKDGKFVFVGTTEEALERYEAKEVIDLEGKTVLPGMGDFPLAFLCVLPDFYHCRSGRSQERKEAIERLAAKAAETPEGEWIKGSNFDQSKWDDCEDQLPTKRRSGHGQHQASYRYKESMPAYGSSQHHGSFESWHRQGI